MRSPFGRRYRTHCLLAACLTYFGLLTHAQSEEEKEEAQTEEIAEVKAMEAAKKIVEAEVAIAEAEFKLSTRELKQAVEELKLENALAKEEREAELTELQAELDRLTKEAAIIERELALAAAREKSLLETELAEMRAELEKVRLTNEIAAAETMRLTRELQRQDAEVQIRQKELAVERAEFEIEVARINAELELREKRDRWKSRVNREIAYSTEPYRDGILTVTDRRIPLNGPISMNTADYVTERIDYYNNQNDEYPIFIVIDRSPGGSVMAGFKILKAMQGSDAPVYVVVKSFAASMAAGITTLAERSFAYPNAIMLHHQILNGQFGNLTQQREQVEELQEWWERLAGPIAEKMGVTLEEFIAEMYENRSTGDWEEFADRAAELRWVDQVVETIVEESVIKDPDIAESGLIPPDQPRDFEEIEIEGRQHLLLPRLDPVDVYYLYNPDGYYRWPQ